jgi:hypothetical protein
MNPVAPSEATVTVLRAVSRAGFAYAPTKATCAAAGWHLVEDEPDWGYVNYEVLLAADSDEYRPLTVLIAESGRTPCAFLPLFYFDDYDEGRKAFDGAFRALAEKLGRSLGASSRSGQYGYAHRAGWPYSFTGWALADATFLLVQDEFDIQFGMDVTLWVQPAGTVVAAPVRHD